jgi:hypothetical protein
LNLELIEERRRKRTAAAAICRGVYAKVIRTVSDIHSERSVL